jgi:hypothetical protein
MDRRRKVRITFARNTWFVDYIDRKKGQRYHAAQFAADEFGLGFVIQWVKSKPHLELVRDSGIDQ